MSYYPKNILVTGGMGFIGSHFVELLCTEDENLSIINLDKLTYAALNENTARLRKFRNHTFIKGDICDEGLIKTIFEKYPIDTVVNFAAESHVDNSISSPENFISTNIVGTFTLLESAKKYWSDKKIHNYEYRFHHVSTDEVYGSIRKNQEPVAEGAVYDPSSPYSSSKASSDHLVRAYYKTYGIPITISHCSNNYGPYQHKEKFIPVVINSCIKQSPIPVYGNGGNIRDWIYVKDHCEAIWSVINYGKIGDSYNIPGGFEISNLDLANLICRIMDVLKPINSPHESLITFVEDRLGHDWRYSISGQKLNKDTNWRPKTKFKDGITDTVKWYLMHEFNKVGSCASA